VQLQLLTGATDETAQWLDKLDRSGTAGAIRALSLEARFASARDPSTDLEVLIEPRANELAAAATRPADQIALYGGIGDLYTSLKQPAAAEPWYRRLVAIAPEQYPLLVASLNNQQRLADAIAVCGEAAKTDLTVRPAMVLIGALTEGQPKEQDFKQANPIIAAVVERFPDDVGLLYAVSLLDLLQGKYDDAVSRYRRILAANSQHAPALNNQAMLLAERPADRDEAIRLIDRAIEIMGKDPGLLDTKGAILVYSSRPAQAVPLLESAIQGDNADPRHHFHLAVAYRDLGKLDQAKAQLKIALDRQLDRQLLMPTDQRLLAEMRSALSP
jgi:tetratricopeptide (TPR) repeat protein